MTVVVTGGAGHLGGTLVRTLLARNRSVRVLVHRDRRAVDGLNVEIVPGDVRDLDSLCRAFEGAPLVYHTAARISLRKNDWPLLEAINVDGTRNVVEACLRCGVRRLVHVSSIHALDQQPLDVPLDESRPLVESPRRPPYDRSKAAGEQVVRQAIKRGLDAVIVYPTGIIGPYDFRPSHFGRVLLALAQGHLPALVAGGFDWVDVRDVAEGAAQAAERAPAGARYLLSGRWASLRELAAMAAEVTGAQAPAFVCPLWLADLGLPVVSAFWRLDGGPPLFTGVSLRALRSNRCVCCERAGRELDYRPRPLRQTVRDTYRWFESVGCLARS